MISDTVAWLSGFVRVAILNLTVSTPPTDNCSRVVIGIVVDPQLRVWRLVRLLQVRELI